MFTRVAGLLVNPVLYTGTTKPKPDMSFSQIYIVTARCVTTKKARKDGCLPTPMSVGRRKIMIMNDLGTMII